MEAACRFPRCPRPAVVRGLCSAHARAQERTRETLEPWRAWYRTEAWARLRQWKLRTSPRCQCGVVDCRRPSAVVDHRVPHRGDPQRFWELKNLQAFAKVCHDRKTAREVNARRSTAR